MFTDPELLILDEPTAGLDPLVQQTFNELLFEARTDGRTVFLSSHILSEVERACDRVSIVRAGRVVDTGSLDELRPPKPEATTAAETTEAAAASGDDDDIETSKERSNA